MMSENGRRLERPRPRRLDPAREKEILNRFPQIKATSEHFVVDIVRPDGQIQTHYIPKWEKIPREMPAGKNTPEKFITQIPVEEYLAKLLEAKK